MSSNQNSQQREGGDQDLPIRTVDGSTPLPAPPTLNIPTRCGASHEFSHDDTTMTSPQDVNTMTSGTSSTSNVVQQASGSSSAPVAAPTMSARDTRRSTRAHPAARSTSLVARNELIAHGGPDRQKIPCIGNCGRSNYASAGAMVQHLESGTCTSGATLEMLLRHARVSHADIHGPNGTFVCPGCKEFIWERLSQLFAHIENSPCHATQWLPGRPGAWQLLRGIRIQLQEHQIRMYGLVM